MRSDGGAGRQARQSRSGLTRYTMRGGTTETTIASNAGVERRQRRLPGFRPGRGVRERRPAGIPRPQDGTCDIGSAERVPGPATISVNTVGDQFGGVGGPQCSLREAIQAANQQRAFGGCPAGSDDQDTIDVPAGGYSRSLSGEDDDDFNARGDLDIVSPLLHIRSTDNRPTLITASGSRALDISSHARGESLIDVEGLELRGRCGLRGGRWRDPQYRLCSASPTARSPNQPPVVGSTREPRRRYQRPRERHRRRATSRTTTAAASTRTRPRG